MGLIIILIHISICIYPIHKLLFNIMLYVYAII